MRPEPIWDSTSNVHFLGRSPASAGSSQSHRWAASITVMNALQRNDMAADGVLANDRQSNNDSRVWRQSDIRCHRKRRTEYDRWVISLVKSGKVITALRHSKRCVRPRVKQTNNNTCCNGSTYAKLSA